MQRRHIVLAVGIPIFAWFAWPTPYRYASIAPAHFCRLNIFTSSIECTTGDGTWERWK